MREHIELDRYDFGITGGRVLGRIIGRRVRVHLVAATQPMPPAAVQARR